MNTDSTVAQTRSAKKSPKHLDDKILAYAKAQAMGKKSGGRAWYGYGATACVLFLAVLLLPKLSENIPAAVAPQSPMPSPTMAETGDQVQAEIDYGQSDFASAPPSQRVEQLMAKKQRQFQQQEQRRARLQKAKNKRESQLAAMSKLKRQQGQKDEAINGLSEFLSNREDPPMAVDSMLRQVSLADEYSQQRLIALEQKRIAGIYKKRPKVAEIEYGKLRIQCDCELPENLEDFLEKEFDSVPD